MNLLSRVHNMSGNLPWMSDSLNPSFFAQDMLDRGWLFADGLGFYIEVQDGLRSSELGWVVDVFGGRRRFISSGIFS